jgi:glycosyl transferase family 25
MINNITDIKNIFYINLEHRTDRREHVETQLALIGLKARRFNAINMKYGAIGCTMSHLKLLENAYKNNLDHILIIEDDILFLEPILFTHQFNKCLLNHKNWDVIILSGNNIPPYKKIDDSCVQVYSCQTTTGYLVNGHYIKTLHDNIKEGLELLIRNPTNRINYAIDRYWFNLQQLDKWYLIIPLTVVQREDYSDIEKRDTNYINLMMDLDKPFLKQLVRQKK